MQDILNADADISPLTADDMVGFRELCGEGVLSDVLLQIPRDVVHHGEPISQRQRPSVQYPMISERFVRWKESHRPEFLRSGDQSALHPSDRLTVGQLLSWNLDQLVGWTICQIIKRRDGGGSESGRSALALEVFKATYYWTSRPSQAVIYLLHRISGYPMRDVNQWFSYRRQHERDVVMR